MACPQEIKRITALKNIDFLGKIQLILVLSGKKQVSELSLGIPKLSYPAVELPAIRTINPRKIKNLQFFVKSLGLYCTPGPITLQTISIMEDTGELIIDKYQQVLIYFSLTERALHLLVNKIPTDYEAGILYGFPKTAVEAFCFGWHDGLIEEAELPPEVVASAPYRFAGFRLSRRHWQKELCTATDWSETIKALAPPIFREMLSAEILKSKPFKSN